MQALLKSQPSLQTWRLLECSQADRNEVMESTTEHTGGVQTLHEKGYPKKLLCGDNSTPLHIGVIEKLIYRYTDMCKAQWNNLFINIGCIILMGNKRPLLSLLNTITGNCLKLNRWFFLLPIIQKNIRS